MAQGVVTGERETGVLSALYFPYLRGLAHELNNPLTGILGYAQLLGLGIGGDEGSTEELKEIETCAVRCRDLVALLSRCAKAEEGPTSLNLEQVFGDVVHLAEPLAHRRSIHLDVKRAEGLAPLQGWPWRLRACLLGLVGVGLETPEDGNPSRLGLRLSAASAGARIELDFPLLEADALRARLLGEETPDLQAHAAPATANRVLTGLGYQVTVEERSPGSAVVIELR